MFSVFVYLFSAAVSFWASRYFFTAWKKSRNENHRDFYRFFIFLGLGLSIYSIPTGITAEVGNLSVLSSFAFVLRAFVRFQQIKSISPDFVSGAVIVLSSMKFFIGITRVPQPVTQGMLVYWHYAFPDAFAFSVCIVLFTLMMTVTLLANVANMKKNKLPLFFLGLAFSFGGIGGALVVLANDFWPLLFSYIFILAVFLCVSVFILSARRKEA